jgi:hypothetical protein
MRTTVRLDDKLLAQLKAQARTENLSLTRVLNRALSEGLHAATKAQPAKPRFRQKTYAMGPPRVNLDKALALAAALDDEEILRKPSRSK